MRPFYGHTHVEETRKKTSMFKLCKDLANGFETQPECRHVPDPDSEAASPSGSRVTGILTPCWQASLSIVSHFDAEHIHCQMSLPDSSMLSLPMCQRLSQKLRSSSGTPNPFAGSSCVTSAHHSQGGLRLLETLDINYPPVC